MVLTFPGGPEFLLGFVKRPQKSASARLWWVGGGVPHSGIYACRIKGNEGALSRRAKKHQKKKKNTKLLFPDMDGVRGKKGGRFVGGKRRIRNVNHKGRDMANLNKKNSTNRWSKKWSQKIKGSEREPGVRGAKVVGGWQIERRSQLKRMSRRSADKFWAQRMQPEKRGSLPNKREKKINPAPQ